jgi:AcrR family transcriptional regulator
MGKRPIDAARMLDRALGLVAERGWSGTSLAEMAAAAALPLETFCAHYPSKAAVLRGLVKRVDSAMLSGVEAGAGEGARDRLFDAIMRRFDALNLHKAAVRAIARDVGCDPLAIACGAGPFCRVLSRTLEAANLDAGGLRGLARIHGLSWIYLSAMRTWLRDDTEDMAKTMATLDRRLATADRVIGMLCRGFRRAPSEAEPAAA